MQKKKKKILNNYEKFKYKEFNYAKLLMLEANKQKQLFVSFSLKLILFVKIIKFKCLNLNYLI